MCRISILRSVPPRAAGGLVLTGLKQMLKEYVDITNAGTYDFLYLRIDFQNRCKYDPPRFKGVNGSVGYAFINFIDPKSIIPFAKARVGTKWCRTPPTSLPVP
jgi:RNA recognition motif 2